MPVAATLDGDTFWLIAVHGEQAGYVRNLEAHPQVRVQVRGAWRSGRAQVMPAEAPVPEVFGWYPRLGLRLVAADPRIVRIDLEHVSS